MESSTIPSASVVILERDWTRGSEISIKIVADFRQSPQRFVDFVNNLRRSEIRRQYLHASLTQCSTLIPL